MEPEFVDEEPIASVAWDASFNRERLCPGFSVVLTKEITHRVIATNERKITIKGIVPLEVSVVSLIDRSVEFEFLLGLLEEGGFAEVIVGA